MKKTLFFLAAAAVLSLNAEVLWEADFSKELAGFRISKNKPEDSIKAENGELVMQFTNGAHKGIEIKQEIPFPERGDLSFDITMNVGKKKDYGSWSLKMILFGQMIAWHRTGFSVYTPGVTPNNWTDTAELKHDQKVNCRFRFDRTKGTLDIFVDHSLLPVKTLTGIKYSKASDGKGILTFANYGYCKGNPTHKISNLKLETVEETSEITEAKVVWSEKFEKDGTPADNGFKLTLDNKKDQFTVKDGELTMICQNDPHKGMRYEREIPGLLRGELTFEASTGGGTGYDYYSLCMKMGGMMISWRARKAWHLYHPSENKWYVLNPDVENGVWHKYKIVFDAEERTAEFYVDDMENPVFIDTKIEYTAKRNVVLQINNYGLSAGTVVNKLRNLELKALPKKKSMKETL